MLSVFGTILIMVRQKPYCCNDKMEKLIFTRLVHYGCRIGEIPNENSLILAPNAGDCQLDFQAL